MIGTWASTRVFSGSSDGASSSGPGPRPHQRPGSDHHFTRRSLLFYVVLSLTGSRALARHNRICYNLGTRRERDGLTTRELAYLERKGCRKDPLLGWVSGLFWEA